MPTGLRAINTRAENAPPFDIGKFGGGIVCLTRQALTGFNGGTVDSKVLLKSAYSEPGQPAVPSIEKRTLDHWSDRVSMTAVLFLSLGLWAVIWEAIASLASAVFR